MAESFVYSYLESLVRLSLDLSIEEPILLIIFSPELYSSKSLTIY